MEPENSLLCSAELTTGPCLEPNETNLHPPAASLVYALLLYSHQPLGLPTVLCPWGCPTKDLWEIFISAVRATCPTYILPYLIMLIIYGRNEIIM